MMGKTICTTSPRSFLFYVVADIESPETIQTRRPLAVTYRQGHGIGPSRHASNPVPFDHQRVYHLIEDCARIVAILTDPTNRPALEAEVSLARAHYLNLESDAAAQSVTATRPEVTDSDQPTFDLSIPRDTRPCLPDRPELSWPNVIPEYPFTSTCLRLALNADREYHTRFGDVQERPLNTVFRSDRLEHGAAVFNITSLDNLTYGILSPSVNYELDNFEDILRWDPVESVHLQENPSIRIEQKSTSRRLLSVEAYMNKYHFYDENSAVRRLARYKIVGPSSLTYISPSSRPNAVSETVDTPPQRRSRDNAISQMIEQAQSQNGLDMGEHQSIIRQPRFQERLQVHLEQNTAVLKSSHLATQLLRLAYSGIPHLNWVATTSLTFDVIVKAIQSAELEDAQALSICIDNINPDDGVPDSFWKALSGHSQLRTICFLQAPSRPNDERCAQVFAQLYASPAGRRVLGSKRVIATSSFCAPFRRKRWLPHISTNTMAPLESFPVQQMFVRQQYLSHATDGGSASQKFRPCHFSFSDILLKPEHLVDAFLRYCQSIVEDKYLLSFAATRSRMAATEGDFPGMTINPISAENISIPDSWTLETQGKSERQVDLWPLFRHIEPGGWLILVSREWHKESPRTVDEPYDIPLVRYAFIRAKQRIELPSQIATTVDEIGGENYVEAKGGVKDFLCETEPFFNEDEVDLQVMESIEAIRRQWHGRLPPDVSPITIMDSQEATAILKDFLHDAMLVRENMKLAVRGIPEEERWFPELMTNTISQMTSPRKRRRLESGGSSSVIREGIFTSLYDVGTQVVNPTGTDRAPISPFASHDDEDL
ncbi:hypothetical protein LZ30DRAFT_775559 [Colletotrichum cereale]|nr:hypothetical protein LZ30DRAFT_775559 [Colletotrichum cereale]